MGWDGKESNMKYELQNEMIDEMHQKIKCDIRKVKRGDMRYRIYEILL